MTEAVAEIKESHAKLGGCYVRCLGQKTTNQPVLCFDPAGPAVAAQRPWGRIPLTPNRVAAA